MGLSNLLISAEWAAQLGNDWRVIFQRPHGVVTVGILLSLSQRYQGARNRRLLLKKMMEWFALSGYYAITQRVPNALNVGQTVSTSIKERSITERQSVEAHGDSKF